VAGIGCLVLAAIISSWKAGWLTGFINWLNPSCNADKPAVPVARQFSPYSELDDLAVWVIQASREPEWTSRHSRNELSPMID
jgi:hypothetical protein